MNPLSYYLNASYLFNLRPEPLGPAGRLVVPSLAIGMLVLGVVGYRYAKRLVDPIRRAGYRRISTPLVTMGVIGTLYSGAAWVGAPLLSTRLILLGWLLLTVVWISVAAWREAKTQPAKRAAREQRLRLEKYLPK